MSATNADPPHQRHLLDLSAHRAAADRPGSLNQTRPSGAPKPRIPQVLVQVQSRDQVPVGMYAAIQSLIESNPGFEHRYFSDRSAAEWMDQHATEQRRVAFRSLIPPRMRAQYFVLNYLFANGGVYIDPAMTASRKSFSVDGGLTASDEFVASVSRIGRISSELLAVVPQHPIIGQALRTATELIAGAKYGNSASDITGDQLLTKAFKAVEGTSPMAPHHRNGIRLHDYVLTPGCLIGAVQVVDAARTAEPLLWTRYPTYGRETRWYRLRSDDAEAAWQKRMVYGDHECPFGHTLADEKSKLNVAPMRSRVLVDMAATHPATAAAKAPQKIPRIIMQTNRADRVPKDLRKAMESVIAANPEYDHYYYSDGRIRDFIKQHFDKRTLEAFDAVVPGAFKSDLFRYCFLYVKGGVYLDGDVVAVRPIDDLIRADDEFVSAEDCGLGWVHNAFMASVPGHPILRAAIDKAVERIRFRRYGTHALWITGPILLKAAFRSVVKKPITVGSYSNGVRLVAYTREEGCMVGQIEEGGRVVLWMRYDTYRAEMRWFAAGTPHYADLWTQGRVFVNGNRLGAGVDPKSARRARNNSARRGFEEEKDE